AIVRQRAREDDGHRLLVGMPDVLRDPFARIDRAGELRVEGVGEPSAERLVEVLPRSGPVQPRALRPMADAFDTEGCGLRVADDLDPPTFARRWRQEHSVAEVVAEKLGDPVL